MRPDLRARAAEDAAKKLQTVLGRPEVAQLLQQPLPAQPNAEQRAVLTSCITTLVQLSQALPSVENPINVSDTAAFRQLLRGVLRHRAVHSAATLLVWLLQQPQQLAVTLQNVEPHQLQRGTTKAACVAGMHAVTRLAQLLVRCIVKMHRSGSSTANVAQLTVNMTHQLVEAGGCA